MGGKKTYNSVLRELPWEVVTRSGVQTKTLTIFRSIQEGMRARLRTDDGEHSEWSEVTKGLRQGSVLSPLMFYLFFAGALHIALVRFSIYEIILRGSQGIWFNSMMLK